MLKKTLSLVLGCLFLAGCSLYHVDSQDTTLDFYPPKDSPEKIVYLEKVDKPFEVIGIVTVTTERTHSFEEVLVRIKYEAAMLGGDAVTDIRTDAAGSWGGVKPPSFFQNAYIRAHYSAKVIVLK